MFLYQQVDENIYYARQNLSSDLLLTLQAAEKRRQEEKNEDTVEPPDVGFLTQKEFSEELVQYFGITHQEDMLFLLKMALQQLQTKGNIEYTKLFLLVMSTPTLVNSIRNSCNKSPQLSFLFYLNYVNEQLSC